MSRPLIIDRIWSDPNNTYTPALSGGSWGSSGDVALTNLQTRRLTQVARSTDDATASTKFVIDLGTPRAVDAVVLCAHNISIAGLVRVSANSSNSFGSPAYTSGWFDAYGTAYPDLEDWGTLGNAGELTQEEYDDGFRQDAIHVPATAQTYRYWQVEIDDTTNPDGYIEIGRLVIGGAWRPSTSAAEGFRFGYETKTARTETDFGVALFDEKPRRKAATMTLPKITDNEALTFALDAQRRLLGGRQLYYIHDPDGGELRGRMSMLCTVKEWPNLEFPAYRYINATVSLIEEL